MPASTLSLTVLLGAASFAAAQVTGTYPATPLASKTFSYPSGIPYKVDTDQGLVRGTQTGYNICNSTTENQESMCQTSFFNDYNDFCLWAPSEPGSLVADVEGEMIAWCSKPGHGTRLIPEGALTGLQFLKTPDFIQIVGFIDQTKINMAANDSGGEMDPHGAGLRGNPMGGIMFSNAWTGGYVQAVEWTNFMGNSAFCLKACDPSQPSPAQYCQHIYDRIGCAYNAPNAAQNNIFESCDADSGDFPGVYTSNGVVQTYTQPAESLGAITTQPYEVKVPASSNCKTWSSEAIFTGLPSASGSATSGGASATGTASGLTKVTGSASKSASATGSAQTGTASSEATTLAISGLSVLGVVFSAIFLS